MADSLLDADATRVFVRHLTPSAVRITHAAHGAPAAPLDRPWLADVLLPQPPLAPGQPRLGVDCARGRVHVRSVDGALVLAEAQPARLDVRRRTASFTVDIPALEARLTLDRRDDGVSLAWAIQAGEHFYGWGEWFNAFYRREGRIELKARDAIALIQHSNTYSAIPMFYSSRGYAVWLLNSHATSWRIRPEQGALSVIAAGPGADYIVIHGPTFGDILREYTALTGRPPLLPRWALGLMVTGFPQEPQDVVLARVDEHRRRDIPLDAVILDYHWEEAFHNFRWRKSMFPDPDGLIASLRRQGVRLGLIFTPFVNHRTRPIQKALLHRLTKNLPAGREADDERALPEYAHALERGYLAHPDSRWWFGAGGMIDFTNPEAAAWWNGMLAPLYAQGAAFFKNDDGEYLPPNGRSALGMDGREYHNLYGFYYGRAIYDGITALDRRRGFIYARSVWAGSQRYPALFLGDQKPTFEHLAGTLRAGLGLGLLGFAHWTPDVFGLDGKTTPELHQRYAQWALLAPVARYFWRPPHVDDTRFPWSHGPATEANFRAYAHLRSRLLPYYCALGWQAHLSGMPPLRPMLLEYPFDERLAALDDQAMLGECLLIAPVTTPADRASGVAGRKIVLPAGAAWHDFWTDETHAGGGEIDYHAPLDRLPLLARGGTILPLGPVNAHIPDGHAFDQLEFHCWPPYPAQAVFYDDDGWSRDYQSGAYSTTRVSAEGSHAAGRVAVTVEAAQGAFDGQPAARQVRVVLQRSPRTDAVRINGAAAEAGAWAYDEARRTAEAAHTCPVDAPTEFEFLFALE